MDSDDQLRDGQIRFALSEAQRLCAAGFYLTPVRIHRLASGKKGAQFFKGWRRAEAWSNDFEVVRDWWTTFGGCSFAYSCAHSGVEGVDLDRKGDVDAPTWWAQQGYPIGELTVRTPSGSEHHVWRVRDDELHLPQEAGGTFPGVDTRNRSGLFFAPGAFVEGEEGSYEVVGELLPIYRMAVTPADVIALFPGRADREEHARDGQIIEHDLEWQRQKVGEALTAVREHNRNDGGYRTKIQHLGLMYGRVVEQGHATAEKAEERFLEAHRSVWGPDVWPENLKDFRDALRDGPQLERWRAPEKIEEQAAAGSADAADTLVELYYTRAKAKRVAERRLDAEEAGEPAPPSSSTLTELLAEPDEDTPYLVHGLWPIGGKVILSAQQKAGKTTMVGNVLRALVDGDPMLGPRPGTLIGAGAHPGFDVEKLAEDQSVFVADFELDRRMVRRWLRDHRIRHADRVHVETFRGQTWDVRDDKVRTRWARHLRDRGVRIVILDPLAPVLSSLNIDEIDNKGVGQFLHAMDALVAEAGAGELLITHHTTHGGERGRGASVLRGWPDAEWRFVVERPDNGGEPEPDAARFFTATGRDVAEPERALAFDPNTRTLTIVGGSRYAHAVDKHADAVVKLVETTPGITKRDLQDEVKTECKVSSGSASAVISSAVKAGLLHTHPGPNRALLHYPAAPNRECPVCLDAGLFMIDTA